MTIREAVREGAAALRSSAISRTPSLDSELLIAHILNIARGEVIAHGLDALDEDTLQSFRRLIHIRASGTPIAYITGVKEFYGLEFVVTPAVLIPKSDTERMVELSIEIVRGSATHTTHTAQTAQRGLTIADICCGSGSVGISVAHECMAMVKSVCFTDISPSALDVCRVNAQRLLTDNGGGGICVEFFCGDLLSMFDKTRHFDLILSNPPYIPSDEVTLLLRDGRGEPRLALDGDNDAQADSHTMSDGLALTRRLVIEAAPHLSRGGTLIIESSEMGVHATALMMKEAGLIDVAEYTDLSGQPRVAAGKSPPL